MVIYFNFFGGVNLLERPFIGWGIIYILACVACIGVSIISAIKPELLDKQGSKLGKIIFDYVPGIAAFIIFIISFALGVTFASASVGLAHCGVGFYFVLFGSIIVMAVTILKLVNINVTVTPNKAVEERK